MDKRDRNREDEQHEEGQTPRKNHLISRRMVRDFLASHSEAKKDEAMMIRWCKTVEDARWDKHADITQTLADVHKVGEVDVSNVCKNRYRFVFEVDYRGDRAARVYMVAVLNHDEYDDWEFK